MFTPKQEKARILGQINSCYSNSNQLITPKINQIEFEKAINDDKLVIFVEDMFKSYSESALEQSQNEEDDLKKSEILINCKKELSRLSKIDIVFNNLVKSVWVDSIDIETNTYKDSSINRILNRVGKAV